MIHTIPPPLFFTGHGPAGPGPHPAGGRRRSKRRRAGRTGRLGLRGVHGLRGELGGGPAPGRGVLDGWMGGGWGWWGMGGGWGGVEGGEVGESKQKKGGGWGVRGESI